MKILRRLLAFAVLVALLVLGYRFAQANGAPVAIDLLLADLPAVPQWMVLLATFALGTLLATVVLLFQMAKLGLVARRYRKTVRGLESEIHQLRNLPLAGGEGVGPAAPPGAATGAEPGGFAGPSA